MIGDRRPRAAKHIPGADLTAKEMAVLIRIAEGAESKIISMELGVTDDAIKARINAMFIKLQASNRAHAVAIAYQLGLLRTPAEPTKEGVEVHAVRCCSHCLAMTRVLTDGKGEDGMMQRMYQAVREAALRLDPYRRTVSAETFGYSDDS